MLPYGSMSLSRTSASQLPGETCPQLRDFRSFASVAPFVPLVVTDFFSFEQVVRPIPSKMASPPPLVVLGLLTRTLDESAEIADGQVEWEVDAGQQLDEEQIPTQQARHKGQSTSRVLTLERRLGGLRGRLCDLPEGARQAGKGGDEGAEDAEEDDVGAERADEVDKAEQTHVDLEEGEGGGELGVGRGRGRVCGVVGDAGVEVGRQGSPVGEPERAEGAEDDEGEGVAEDEFEDGAKDHKQAAEEIVCTNFCGTETTRASPAKENIGQGCQREQETGEGKRSGIAKSRSNVVRDLVLWRKVDFLEELWRDGKTSGGAESTKSRVLIVMVVVQVITTSGSIDGVTTSVILFDVGGVVGRRHGGGVVSRIAVL